MELVKFNVDDGVITIRVAVKGLLTWVYTYAEDIDLHKGESSGAGPFTHTLGMPHELNNKIHNWDIRLGNVSDEDQDYEIEITWMQENAVLHTWAVSGTLAPDQTGKETGSALLTGVKKETENG